MPSPSLSPRTAFRPSLDHAPDQTDHRPPRVGLRSAVVALAPLTIGLAAFAMGLAFGAGRLPGGAVAAAAPPPPMAVAQAPAGPSANRVYIPALNDYDGQPRCKSMVSVVNLGPEPSKAVLLVWPELDRDPATCVAPAAVLCSGLLRPAGMWDFPRPAAGQAASGVVFSFTAKRLPEIGAGAAGGGVVADHMCETLRSEVIGDCAAYSAFAAAFAQGASYLGVPLDRAAGSPLGVEVHRACPGDATPGIEVTSLYAGTGAHALGSSDAGFGGYRYHAAPLHADDDGLSSSLHVQNAGAQAAAVELWLAASGACDGGAVCRTLAIDPGASAAITIADCAGPGWNGAAWLRSSTPLAVVVDTAGWDTLASFSGVAPGGTTLATGAPVLTTANPALFGPLAYGTAYGWEVDVTVQDLDLAASAEVGVEFLDADGAILSTHVGTVCPRGSTTFRLPLADDRPGHPSNRAGSVRVVSRAPGSGSGGAPAPIAGVVTLRKYADTGRTEMIEAMAYNLVPDAAAFAWPAGGGEGGAASGSPVVVVPGLVKHLDEEYSVTSELAITNHVPVAGWTDLAVLLFDQNALVDVFCRRLGAGQTNYVDVQTFGLIPGSFHASALVSATYWEHPVPADAAGPARQLVGLGAVVVRRSGTRLGEDIPGDELAGEAGISLPAWPDPAGLPPDTCGSAPGRGWEAPSGDYWQSVVPVHGDKAGYTSIVTVRNTGDEPTAVRLYFKALGDCLRDRVCSIGPLAGGATASFTVSDCIGPDWSGSLVLHSREPLEVSAETTGRDPKITSHVWPGRLPFDVNTDGKVDGADMAAVTAAQGSRPGDPAWNPRADLAADGVVDTYDLDYMRRSLCGTDRAPDSPALVLAPKPPLAHLPVLAFEGDDNICTAEVIAQNVGAAPTKPLLVLWGAPAEDGTCKGPLAIACGGLLRPGGGWSFGPGMLPAGAKSAIAFSFNTRPLSEIGAGVGGNEPAADYLCRTLVLTLVGDCDAYQRFKAAFDAGAVYEGVPLGPATGSALAVEARRNCPGDLRPGADVTGAYAALGTHELGALDPSYGAYLSYVPLIYGDKAGFNTQIHAQNTGAAMATVSLWIQAQDDCSGAKLCETWTLHPGDSRTFDPTMDGSPDACITPDWQGNAWLESDQPLAVTVDIAGRDILMTYPGVAQEAAFDVTGAALPAGGRTTAFGPLFYSHETNWDSGVQVQNLSRTRPAQVRVEFLDAHGAQITVLDDLVCAAGSQTFFLPVENSLPGLHVGSLRVISQRLAGDPSNIPAPIAAYATLIHYSDPARTITLSAAAYRLYSEREAIARAPGAAGGTATGIGAVALGELVKPAGGNTTTSEIAISNFVHAPGWTEVGVLFYDANGLVDVACRRIDANSVAYLDLAALPLAAGFRGGAIVSATAWRHPVGGTGRGPLRNLVGIGAVVITRQPVGAADELSIAEGVPLAAPAAVLGAGAAARCAAIPTATATPTQTVVVPPTATVPTTATPTPIAGSATPTRLPNTRTPTATGGPRGKVYLPIVWRN